ncbi:MAG TPA: hypothetical protein VF174_06015 [Micromonosporaceae bacterium]
MDATANRSGDDPGRWLPIRLFLSVRPLAGALAGVVLLAALAAWFGLAEAPLPTAVEQGKARIPLWRLLAMGVMVLPVVAMHSSLADLEVVATRRLRALQRSVLAGIGTVSALIYLGSCALVMQGAVVGIVARSLLAWFGLALLSGAVLEWRLAWAVPTVVAVVLWYWGHDGAGRYEWWEFSARPHDDMPSLLISVTLFVAGLVAFAATPWRLRSWRRWLPTRARAGRGAVRQALDRPHRTDTTANGGWNCQADGSVSHPVVTERNRSS